MMSDLERLIDSSKDMLNLFNLEGKTAVVVGGSKGLGQAMTVGLAAAGAKVIVIAREIAPLKNTVDSIKSMGREAEYYSLDVTSEENVIEVVETISKDNSIDILVNSQGSVYLEDTTTFPYENWQAIIDVNLKSVFLCCKHFGKIMLSQKKGKIINVSSVRGFQGRAGDPAYAPSKGAVNQLTRSLAIEWGSKGINVNSIAPVFTYTAISKDFLEDEEKRNWVLSRIPMKRVGELEDLFGPVVFLSSDASNFVNGHILPVDGGWLSA